MARAALWLVVGAWCLFALSWGVLHGLIVPRVGEWRPALESLATRALGVRVQVGAVEAASTGPVPAFTLRDVRLFDPAGREALHLPTVQGALSVRSLWRLGFEQLVVEAPVVSARRTADGRIEVGGMDIAQGGSDSGRLADWFFAQTELAVRGGVLHWQDDTRPEAEPLALTGIDFVVRNTRRQHDWRLDATPPADWGDRFSLRGRLTGPIWSTRPGQWRDWSGTLYAEWPRADVGHLQAHMDLAGLWGLRHLEGHGSARLWFDLQRGRLTAATADLSWDAVALNWQPDAPPLALDALAVLLELRRPDDRRTRVATRGLAFRTGDGWAWPGGDVVYDQTLGPDGGLQAWEVQAERVDLQALQRFMPRLPLPSDWRALADSAQPSGHAEALAVRWQAPQGGQAERWSAGGRLRGLALVAAPAPAAHTDAAGDPVYPLARPGVRGVDLDLQMDQSGGRAQLQVRDGALGFPGVFEEPEIPLERLQAALRWTVTNDRIELDVSELRFANADAEGQGRVRWHTADPARSPAQDRFPGVIDLDLQLARADGARVHRYLPQAIPADVRRYLRAAVPQAQARDARFVVRGDLWDFPYAEPGRGEFEVRAKLRDVVLDYVPPHLRGPNEPAWPALARVDADLHIDRVSLHIGAARGVVQAWPQLRTVQTEARIPDFMASDPVLQVRGQVQGPGPDALAFVNAAPLGGLLGDVLREARLMGPVDLQLGLDLPLNQVDAVRVNGQLRLAGNDLQVSPGSPWLRATTGVLEFSERGFRVPQASARLLGGEARFSGGMERRAGQPVVRFQGQGQVTAEGLQRADDLPAGAAVLAALGRQTSGATAYRARLEFGPDGQSLWVESGLQGLALALPAPLGKVAAEVLPLRYEVTALPAPAGPGGPTRDRLLFELGAGAVPLLSARYEREHGAAGTQVQRGTLSWRSERPDWPARGVQGHFALGDIDLQAWERWADGLGLGAATTEAHRAYWPTDFGVSAERVRHGGRQFHDLVAGGARDGDNWRLSLAARELNGYVEYRPGSVASPGRVYARLARLTLPPSGASEVEALLQGQPRFVPALDVVVDDFELNGRRLGRLEIDAVNRQASLSAQEAVREWRLNTLNLTVPEARLQASGNWALPGGARDGAARRTALKVNLQIDDAGALLARFGMPDVVRGGKGTLGGTVGWIGSPLALDVPSLSGELQLDLQRGQFLKADPGLAKLLGVLSLQSLPRRLALDFRDIFSEGFAFDFVRGNARIAQGVASTNNLQMKGVSAAVLLEGRADIARETQDITAVVIPELNAGTAALIATAINPVTGLGTFLAQFLLRQPLQAAATQEFRITGPWADPQVEKVNRRNIPNEEGAPSRPGAQP